MATQKQEAVDPVKLRDEMLNRFEEGQRTLKENADYYDSIRRPKAIGVAIPPAMRELLAHVGYARLYINALVDRLAVEGFRIGDKPEADKDLWDWWQANNLDSEIKLGLTEALIHGRAYITVSMPDPKVDLGLDPAVPIIRVEPPTSLYAETDPRTRKVVRAIRPIYNQDGTEVIAATLYVVGATYFFAQENGQWLPPETNNHGLELVPVIPIANRTRLSDLYGTSEITPELRSVTDAASAITMLMRAVAEQMGIPQRLLFGVRSEELGIDPDTGEVQFDSYIARILGFKEADGKAMQFAAADLRNFTVVLEELHKQAAAYTGLPPQYLSTQSENPASAEAIQASETRLVMNAEGKHLIFGANLEEAMRVAYQVAKGGEVPPDMLRMETVWRNPATPTYAAKGDAAVKLYSGGTGVIPKERARIDMGYSIEERLEMKKWDEEESAMLALAGMYSPGDPAAPAGAGAGAAKPTPAKPKAPAA